MYKIIQQLTTGREWLREARANIARTFVDALHLAYERPEDLVEGKTPTVTAHWIAFGDSLAHPRVLQGIFTFLYTSGLE